MSERMTPIPFKQLMTWIKEEHDNFGTVFGVNAPYVKKNGKTLPLFKEKLETPFGPAAGPNTQLAQNIVAAYYAGARFFELKTVQKMDGDDLAACINRPCIWTKDEGYNCEWSTELYVPQAFDEYVKAWFAIRIISRLYGLGAEDGFMFNASVGYDLAGIKTPKMDKFIEGIRDASNTPIFKECMEVGCELFPELDGYIRATPSRICDGVTVSTLHGCPPNEIEAIASYLITEKHLNTFVKCNPTILGYEFARSRLDYMGYDYIAFDDRHFREDLQYKDAVPMFHRLKELAEKNGLEFGLKLSNTFPVDVKANELPSEEMYMSGRALYPLTIEMANRFANEFKGALRISYSGGADFFNIKQLFEAGIWPITMATTILKPGGYGRMVQLGNLLDGCEFKPFAGVDYKAVARLSEEAPTNFHYVKPIKEAPDRKMGKDKVLPLIDCFRAPCKSGCPFGQDIPEYIELCGKGLFLEALQVITAKNPLPFITGTICAHHCMDKCMRNHYECPVNIRGTKLQAAEGAFEELLAITEMSREGEKVAIIGGGPAGLAAAYHAQKHGLQATVFEKRETLGGIVRNVIPGFRIGDDAIDNDIALIKKTGAEFVMGKEAPDAQELKAMGFDYIVLACGAEKKGRLNIEGNVMNVIDFLYAFKNGGELKLGRNVAVVGGGNTAMDAARAAKRAEGVEKVTLVYRRNRRYMPADLEELELAIEDGVEFMELVSPVKQANGKLVCNKMKLGDKDASGRRVPVETGETVEVDADTVIAAVGEKVDLDLLGRYGIAADAYKKGNKKYGDVYVVGDASRGPATVADAIADAKWVIGDITGREIVADIPEEAKPDKEEALLRKMKLQMPGKCEADRCINCNTVCESCVSVCPNRANVAIAVPGKEMRQILHVDYMCNECGNCAHFCPYTDGRPYKDKFTLFANEKDFEDSENNGFMVVCSKCPKVKVRLGGAVKEYTLDGKTGLGDLEDLMLTVIKEHGYLLG